MATRRQTIEADQPESSSLLSEDTFSAESLNPALEGLFSELGITDNAEATVHVSLLDADKKGTEAQIWKGDPDDYDLEALARKFGSGSYRVKVYVRLESGHKPCRGNKVFAWKLSREDEAALNAPAPVAQSQAFNQVDIARMIADAVRAALPVVPAVPAPDPMVMLASLADVMHKLQPPAQTMQSADPLTMMRNMAGLMNDLRGDVDPIERGVNANGTDLLMNLINKFGPLLAQALPQAGQVAPQPAAVQIAAPVANNPIQPEPQQTEIDDVSMKLKMGIAFLVQQANAGGMPETYAEVVLDSVPAESLTELLKNPDPVLWLASFSPEVLKHKDWFESLVTACKEMLAEETQPDAEKAVDTAL